MGADTGRRIRWIWIAAVTLSFVAIAAAALVLTSGASAKRIVRKALLGGQSTSLMRSRAKGVESLPLVLAIAEVLERAVSTNGTVYEKLYRQVPASVQKRLPTPLNSRSVLDECLDVLRSYGPDAAPAVPALLHVYQSSDPVLIAKRDQILRTFGVMGRGAWDAMPFLLQELDPAKRNAKGPIVQALIQIDPSGENFETAWSHVKALSGPTLRASNVAEWCFVALDNRPPSIPGTNRPDRMKPDLSEAYRPPEIWLALQVLGLIPTEAEQTLPMMRPYLGDENEVLRGLAATSLGMLGKSAAIALPELKKCLNDEVTIVREASTNAVRAIERRIQ